jgi:hypothetical protein
MTAFGVVQKMLKIESGVIAEYFTICELFRNKFEVVVSPNPNNEDWDCIVIKSPCGSFLDIKLQVKGVLWQEKTGMQPTITGNFSSDIDFDYLVIVVINFDNESDYLTYIVPKQDLLNGSETDQKQGLLCETSKKIRFTNKSIAFSTFSNERYKKIIDEKYLNNWGQIENGITNKVRL